MLCVKVLKISAPFKVNTKFGEKDKVEVVCSEQSTKKEYITTYFVPKAGLPFKEGEDILADIEVNGEYVNLKKVEKIELPPEPPKKDKTEPIKKENGSNMSKEDWADKEKRDFRGRAAMYALSCFVPRTKDDEVSEIDRANEIIAVAEMFVKYIYEGYDKPTEAK